MSGRIRGAAGPQGGWRKVIGWRSTLLLVCLLSVWMVLVETKRASESGAGDQSIEGQGRAGER